jgi:hypothetical protein
MRNTPSHECKPGQQLRQPPQQPHLHSNDEATGAESTRTAKKVKKVFDRPHRAIQV